MTAKIQRIASLAPDVDRVWHAAVHPTVPLLAAACGDKSVRIYSLRTYAHLSSIEGGHKRSVRSVAWKPGAESEAVLATASFDSTVGIWRGAELSFQDREDREALRRNNQDQKGEKLEGHQGEEEEEEEEEEEDWRFAVVLDGHDSEVKGVAWSAGGSLLATCSRDKSVWVWEEMDEDNFETIAVLQDHSQDVKAVCWHPDGEILASASYDDTIRLYREDIDDWMCYSVLTGHDSTVWSISFENAGENSRLVSSSDDLSVRVWSRCKEKETSRKGSADVSIIKSAHGGSEKWETQAILPKMHDRAVYSTSWSPTSGRIASVGADGKLIVYEEKQQEGKEDTHANEDEISGKEGGERQQRWKVIAELEGVHGAQEVNSVSWSRRWDKEDISGNDEILITTGDDGNINIYEIVST